MKRGKTPNRYSLKKIDSLNEELPERIKLIERCGGQPELYTQVYRRNDGTMHEIHRVRCIGGVCELCGLPAGDDEVLEPHEYPKRSAGGKVSLNDSKMCHRVCHMKQHGKPMFNWIRE